ncbi:glutamate-gated chloride channel isoform X27 [Plutella xylostella]|uniref:glutamate-gated chloride channel isoform X27 n=1 Tax=Plutella xylostella TaxID=51655 RepID=UPI0020326549|nr:glutamate-gated chloride channel isoform X27 [Plutella xylostella]
MGWSTAAARALPLLMLGCVSVSALTSDIFAAGKSDKEILDNLLKNSRYDKRLLPPVDDPDFCCGLTSPNDSLAQNRVGLSSLRPRSHNRGVLTVNVSVLLLSLASPDESSLKYEVEFLLQQQWYDPRLRYSNQSHYDFLNAIHHHEDIWLPDTYFIMHGDFKDPIIPMHFALRIYRNGTINYLMRRHLILSCQGRLNIFPFDDPLCSFALESISYESSAITYVWKNDEDTLRKSPSLTTLNAYLIQNQTIPCPIKASWRAEGYSLYEEDEELTCNLCQRRFEEQGNYSCLKVDLIFTRDRAFYFTTVFIPGIILVTSSFITFWLEWNAVPARSMIGNYSCLKVDLIFTRDRSFYFTTVFIPGIILVTSSFITFWLEWNAVPARVMIGVTTMLNFFTTSNGFRSTLPVVSNLTAMNVWDGVCMCFIYASLLEFVCVNYVGRKRPLHNVVYRPGENPVTQRLPAVLSRIGIILASPLEAMALYHWATSETETPQPETSGAADKKRDSTGAAELVNCAACSAGPPGACTHTTNNGGVTEVRKKEPPHPIRVAKTIDVIARITFPTAYAVFLIFFFIHYKAFS